MKEIKNETWVRTLVDMPDDQGTGKIFPAGTMGFVPVAVNGSPLVIEVYENDDRDFGMCLGTIALGADQVEVIDAP